MRCHSPTSRLRQCDSRVTLKQFPNAQRKNPEAMPLTRGLRNGAWRWSETGRQRCGNFAHAAADAPHTAAVRLANLRRVRGPKLNIAVQRSATFLLRGGWA